VLELCQGVFRHINFNLDRTCFGFGCLSHGVNRASINRASLGINRGSPPQIFLPS